MGTQTPCSTRHSLRPRGCAPPVSDRGPSQAKIHEISRSICVCLRKDQETLIFHLLQSSAKRTESDGNQQTLENKGTPTEIAVSDFSNLQKQKKQQKLENNGKPTEIVILQVFESADFQFFNLFQASVVGCHRRPTISACDRIF